MVAIESKNLILGTLFLLWHALLPLLMFSMVTGCDSTAKHQPELTSKLKLFHWASKTYLDNNPGYPLIEGNTWSRSFIPKFKKGNYRCAILGVHAPLGGVSGIEAQTRQVVEVGKFYFESAHLRLYANFQGINSVPNPYYGGPVFLYAAFLQSEVKTTWWDDPSDQLSFKEIVEKNIRNRPKERVFVLLNDGQIRSFRTADWEKVKPILDPHCREVERNQALGFLQKEM